MKSTSPYQKIEAYIHTIHARPQRFGFHAVENTQSRCGRQTVLDTGLPRGIILNNTKGL